MGLESFFYRYYVAPIKYNQGYNIVNTLTYAIILGIAVLLFYKLMKRMRIKVDEDFFRALVPYIISGALMRALTDNGALPRTYLTVSPGAYIVVGLLTFSIVYLVWRRIGPVKEMYRLVEDFGWVVDAMLIFVLIINLPRFHFNWRVLLYFVPSLLLAEGFVWLLTRRFKLFRDNRIIFYTHFYDATTTFVALQFFGFWEQHVLARFMIGLLHTPAAMYVEKLLILVPTMWILDNVLKDEDRDLINFVKLAIFILGLGPGTRNLLDMLLGTA
ncbi:MAG: DUF63 family protein [Thermococci archaeon]|nr:DUF63 family protein [Thermococci archaeon]